MNGSHGVHTYPADKMFPRQLSKWCRNHGYIIQKKFLKRWHTRRSRQYLKRIDNA